MLFVWLCLITNGGICASVIFTANLVVFLFEFVESVQGVRHDAVAHPALGYDVRIPSRPSVSVHIPLKLS